MRRQAGISKYAPALGATHIGRLRAWVLTVCFLATLFLVPLVDLSGEVGPRLLAAIHSGVRAATAGWNGRQGIWGGVLDANRAVLASFDEIESVVEDGSFMARHLRPQVQSGLLRVGAGNERVYPGQDGWLFYRPELDYLFARNFAPHPESPEKAIAEFAADLASRGIRLVLVPVPGKPLVHPEKFANAEFASPPQNPQWNRFLRSLQEAAREEFSSRELDFPEPVVIDPTATLWEARSGGDVFLRTDSHWTPRAMMAVAAQVARQLGLEEDTPKKEKFLLEPVTLSGVGDTAAMLELPKSSHWNAAQEVDAVRVTLSEGRPWVPDRDSELLLLGDSFSNIYSQPELGWGSSSGFPEHLSASLGRSVDALLRNDGGASATRKVLASELARNLDRLKNTRTVVWQFAMRELAVGTWERVPLDEKTAPSPSREFLVLDSGENVAFEAKIVASGPVPRAGETPYADYLTAFLVEDPDGRPAVVYLPTLLDRTLTPASRLRPGDYARLQLTSWSDAEARHGRTNRGELDDLELQLQEPNFGILIP